MSKDDMPENLDLCVVCKTARNLCGKGYCPLLSKWFRSLSSNMPKIDKLDESFAPPSFFVGHFNYPNTSAGPLLTTNRIASDLIDNSEKWNTKSQDDIVKMRLSMIRTKTSINIKKPLESSIIQRSHEMLLGLKPIDVEVELTKAIIPRVTLDEKVSPLGPVASINKLQINENQTPETPIEKAYYDTDLKAGEAVQILGKEHLPIDTITRVFSAGMLGVEKNRKLVPTRWSITAVDDIISKNQIDIIKKYPTIYEYRVFTSYFFGNKMLSLYKKIQCTSNHGCRSFFIFFFF